MLIRADARAIPLVDGCVQTVVTSPPYFGLRDYGTGQQIGLEASPAEYVTSLLAVFVEVWRVCRDDATVWLNLGDSYANDGKWGGHTGGKHVAALHCSPIGRNKRYTGLKPKDLIGIPWRVAFALQDAGWYLRSDIVWSKPNPMPESITDRPTKSHEYIFLLSKAARYFYDADAIKEPYAESTLREAEYGYRGTATKEYAAAGAQDPSETKKRIVETIRRRRGMVAGVTRKNDTHVDHRKHGVNEWDKRGRLDRESHHGRIGDISGRNKRSVWTVPTMPYAGAHFATFPEALIEPCILAGSRPGDLVFDPFIGSGTVGGVSERLMRRWVGTDLSYQHLAKKRTRQRGLRMEAST